MQFQNYNFECETWNHKPSTTGYKMLKASVLKSQIAHLDMRSRSFANVWAEHRPT